MHQLFAPIHRATRWQALAAAALLVAQPALAIDIVVDILGDPVPDGCTPGHCSLREAVSLANSLAGPDRILLPATPTTPLQLSIAGSDEDANATGDLDVIETLEIVGAGADETVLVQTTSDRLIDGAPNEDRLLVLRGLSLQGGIAGLGGAVRTSGWLQVSDAAFENNRAARGGAIWMFATEPQGPLQAGLVLQRVRFSSNLADLSGSGGGGAVFLSSILDSPMSALRIEDCEFQDNLATGFGGAVLLEGLNETFGGVVQVFRTVFSGNRGRVGGAIAAFNFSSFDATVVDSLFDGNGASGSESSTGGAMAFPDGSLRIRGSSFTGNSALLGGALESANLEVVESLFCDNTASLAGGAISAIGSAEVARSTFCSNIVETSDTGYAGGGAISFNGSSLAVLRSTFSGNRALRGGALTHIGGDLKLEGNTIVASPFGMVGQAGTALRFIGNDPADSHVLANNLLLGSCSWDSALQLDVAAHNIEAPNSSCRLATAANTFGNLSGATSVQVNLAPLGDYGGPTPTRPPQVPSLAIDAGYAFACSTLDQRGFTSADGECDIGAVEASGQPPTDELFADGFEP